MIKHGEDILFAVLVGAREQRSCCKEATLAGNMPAKEAPA